MWVKIKGESINFNNVSHYYLGTESVIIYYVFLDSFGHQMENIFRTETNTEAKAIIKQLDKILNVVEL
jgi:hypothetical protein